MRVRSVIIAILLACMLLSLHLSSFAADDKVSGNNPISESTIKTIEDYVKKQMDAGKIPGISLVIVNGDKQIYKKGFGYSDLKANKPVTSKTLFELGSVSKAFTGLGILKLEQEGKLNLNDPASKYIPWLKLKYEGKQVEITIEQFLHQTSGISIETVGDIPVSDSDNAIEDTVRVLLRRELDYKPGTAFQYTTINYDVLGLVIEKVSGLSYEEYMKINVLKPLGLQETFASRKEAEAHEMSLGYKIGFTTSQRYNAPEYRGNAPAGYIITNADDISKWMNIQMGIANIPSKDKSIIEKSHIPDLSVDQGIDGFGNSYACGWSVYPYAGGEIFHSGTNPNFSSHILLRPQEKLGIAVLANMNSSYTQAVATGIRDIIKGNKLASKAISDSLIELDKGATAIVLISLLGILLTMCFIIMAFIQLLKKKRSFIGDIKKKLITLVSTIVFLLCFGFCLYSVSDILFWNLPWSFIKVWGPVSIVTAVCSAFAAVFLFCFYFVFTTFFPKPDDKSFFALIVFSVASGLGNAFIIVVVNQTLNRYSGRFEKGLFLNFILGIILYVLGQKVVRSKLINITNHLVYSKRMQMIDKILKTSYQNVEAIEDGKIQAGLNNDTETISSFANILVISVTNLITLIGCFVYLGIINSLGLIISVLVILLAAGMYVIAGNSTDRLWRHTRDIQNAFFKYINDMISGFKELSLNIVKRNEFKEDMEKSCVTYRDNRIKADIKFTNVFVIGELLFVFVIGVVAFIFPLVFKDMNIMSLKDYVFVFLYMTGPVRSMLNVIPSVIQMRISWGRINSLISQIAMIETNTNEEYVGLTGKRKIHLELKGVEYQYKNDNRDTFSVGPIDGEFNSGEITFITGGNGSGKSTLAKLITGLYKPCAGEIKVNGNIAAPAELGQQNSAIFSDFYLFDKLYGIDYKEKSDKIDHYLRELKIEDKVQIIDGKFSTIKLSTGQRKRLALLISYLEDKPVCIFDEWAADQDPEYRKYFYYVLLPELKNKGKCVIAITHDDRYFDVADKVIKMDLGRIAQERLNIDAGKLEVGSI